MSEKALLFGERKSLVGIVSDPEPSIADSERPGIVMLNAGLIHRVGPNRIHVKLARALTAQGFVVLRFDNSGIGDSRPPEDGKPLIEHVESETRAGLDLLAETRGLTRFILFGICSGADKALYGALKDERVMGAFMVDPYHYPSLASFIHANRKRLLSPRSWFRFLTGRSRLWTSLKSGMPPGGPGPAMADEPPSPVPPPSAFLSGLETVGARGAHLCLVYSAKSPAYFHYRTLIQGRMKTWAFRDRVTVCYFGDSDHVFTLRSNQDKLVRTVNDWLCGVVAGLA